MEAKTKKIGAFDAKTHLSKILEEVEKGEEYVITRRGKPSAKLVPYRDADYELKMDEILARFDRIRNSVKRRVTIKEIKEWIAEGRE